MISEEAIFGQGEGNGGKDYSWIKGDDYGRRTLLNSTVLGKRRCVSDGVSSSIDPTHTSLVVGAMHCDATGEPGVEHPGDHRLHRSDDQPTAGQEQLESPLNWKVGEHYRVLEAKAGK